MQKFIKTKYVSQQAVFAFAKYHADGSTAITLHDPNDGERVMTVTTCLAEYGLKPEDDRHIFVKEYSENAGIMNALALAGVIGTEVVGYEIGAYGAQVFKARLTDEAYAEFKRQQAERGEGG